ncbi:PA0069 family radical SAM protein [Balneolales bacterium ANBcel1]|nr:PA0069 family radical SAM protein [Balneolales bacterium ANBcel1]
MSEWNQTGESIRGRGTASNPAGRFTRLEVEPDPENSDGISPKTRFYQDDAASVIATNDSPDVPFEASLNPYRGCEHGCVYCYARPFHEYLDMSPGLDFETRIMVKKDAAAKLRKQLQSPAWKPRTVSVSGVTDPYQPVERKLGITRRCLEVLSEFRNPFTIITKNHLVTRDIDLIGGMAELGAARVMVSLTSLDPGLVSIMEPRTSRPARRLETIRELSRAGITVGAMFGPLIPALTDEELPRLVEQAAEAGASFGSYIMLRLPGAVGPLFEDWLEKHYPQRKQKIISRLKALRGGALSDHRFGYRMKGEGAFAEQIRQSFQISCRRYGLKDSGPPLTNRHFRRVPTQGELELY